MERTERTISLEEIQDAINNRNGIIEVDRTDYTVSIATVPEGRKGIYAAPLYGISAPSELKFVGFILGGKAYYPAEDQRRNTWNYFNLQKLDDEIERLRAEAIPLIEEKLTRCVDVGGTFYKNPDADEDEIARQATEAAILGKSPRVYVRILQKQAENVIAFYVVEEILEGRTTLKEVVDNWGIEQSTLAAWSTQLAIRSRARAYAPKNTNEECAKAVHNAVKNIDDSVKTLTLVMRLDSDDLDYPSRKKVESDPDLQGVYGSPVELKNSFGRWAHFVQYECARFELPCTGWKFIDPKYKGFDVWHVKPEAVEEIRYGKKVLYKKGA